MTSRSWPCASIAGASTVTPTTVAPHESRPLALGVAIDVVARLANGLVIVKPETVVAWHRQGGLAQYGFNERRVQSDVLWTRIASGLACSIIVEAQADRRADRRAFETDQFLGGHIDSGPPP